MKKLKTTTTVSSTLLNADEVANKTVDKLMTNPMFKKFLQDIMSPLTNQIASLETKVEKLGGTVFDLQKDNEKMTREQEEKDAQIAVLQESLSMDRDVIIDLQQAQNRNMLMISGVPEKKREIDPESASAVSPEDTESVVMKLVKENLALISKKMTLIVHTVLETHIKEVTNQVLPRPIFVKFTRYNVRKKIIKS